MSHFPIFANNFFQDDEVARIFQKETNFFLANNKFKEFLLSLGIDAAFREFQQILILLNHRLSA